MLNLPDILLEVSSAHTALTQGDYPAFGTWLGKLTSDVLVKNPLTPGWQRHNSEVMRGDADTERIGGKMMRWLGMGAEAENAE